MNLAVVGAGDTANCVMERILPLVYPNGEYGPSNACSSMPLSIVWIGQTARDIRDYFFANKTRYAHAGGLIELFWDGDEPFELPLDTWRRAKGCLRLISERLVSIEHRDAYLELKTENEHVAVDLAVDCTGRSNPLTDRLHRSGHHLYRVKSHFTVVGMPKGTVLQPLPEP